MSSGRARRFGRAVAATATVLVLPFGAGVASAESDEDRYRSERAGVSGGVLVPRVLNGIELTSDDLPFVVSIGVSFGNGCTGSLTSPTTVVTAAHCLFVAGDRSRPIAPGTFRLVFSNGGRPGAREAKVAKVAVHPGDTEGDMFRNDIGVLTLVEPVTDIPYVQLLTPEESAAYAPAWTSMLIAGYGASDAAGTQFPLDARVGVVQLFPDDACGGGRSYRLHDVVWQGIPQGTADPVLHVCAAGVNFAGERVQICFGDSGGPLTRRIPSLGYRLVGVANAVLIPPGAAEGCGYDYPDIFARVSAHYAFLSANGAASTQPWTPPSPTSTPKPPPAPTPTPTPTPTPSAGGSGGGGGEAGTELTFHSAGVAAWKPDRSGYRRPFVRAWVVCDGSRHFSVQAELQTLRGRTIEKFTLQGGIRSNGVGSRDERITFKGEFPEEGFLIVGSNAECWNDDSPNSVGYRAEFWDRCRKLSELKVQSKCRAVIDAPRRRHR